MKHPPYSRELDELYPNMIYTDIYQQYPIGEISRYWTKLLIDNGIRLDKMESLGKGWIAQRPYYEVFPWSVVIIHMHTETINSISRLDSYKINFNLECREVIIDDSQECEVSVMGNGSVSVRHKGQIGYMLSKNERTFIENLFKGKWVDYLDIQGSRIIVQFWLEDYYPIFRKEKILHIKKNLLPL